VASVASTQLMQDGQITSWTSLAAAALGPVSTGSGKGAVDIFPAIGGETGAAVASYVTPWAKMAETYVRNDGELTATDWATAVGSTMTTAIDRNNLGRSDEGNMALRMAGNMVVGGALSSIDREAGQTYLMESVGQEVGQYIGQKAGNALDKMFADFQYQRAMEGAMPDTYDDWDGGSLLAAPTSYDHLGGNESGPLDDSYRVKSGDTLSQIIVEQYGGYDEALMLKIAAYNNLSDPNQIRADQTLLLPPADSDVLADIERSELDLLRERLKSTHQIPWRAETDMISNSIPTLIP
jgi:hypothetical protein